MRINTGQARLFIYSSLESFEGCIKQITAGEEISFLGVPVLNQYLPWKPSAMFVRHGTLWFHRRGKIGISVLDLLAMTDRKDRL